jgi:uncharacterized protein YxjI
MNFKVKQHLFKWAYSYEVQNEEGATVYLIRSDNGFLYSRYHVFDIFGNELFAIKRLFPSWEAQYDIYAEDEELARIKVERSSHTKFSVDSCYGRMDIIGDYEGQQFKCLLENKEIGNFRNLPGIINNVYDVCLADTFDSGFFSCLVVAIDNALVQS